MSIRRYLPLVLAATLAVGCQAGYVIEQGYYQLDLNRRQVAIDSREVADALSPEEIEKLGWVQKVLEFSRERLGLDPGDSYQTFVNTGGDPVSYIVVASHPLALIATQWHFPFVGIVPYKGFFDLEDARSEAEYLRAQGQDTILLPVAAYSTLGWFQDPVLSSMLEEDLASLVDLLIHESTHRTVYFPDRTSFNESLATHVAREGTVRFLLDHKELRPLVHDYLANRRMLRKREELLVRLKSDLEALYRASAPDAEKLRRKEEIFRTTSRAYRLLGPETGSSEIPSSNAYVLSISQYHRYEPLLRRAQEELGGDPSTLVSYLKGLSKSENPVESIEESLGITES